MRVARWIEPGTVYHVISRFVDRKWRILDDDDRALYDRLFAYAIRKCDWTCLGRAMMNNHLHVGFVAGEKPFGTLLQQVHSPFARLLNEKYEGLGPVFADRATAWAIRDAATPRLLAYIHNNPVRAGVVSTAAESTWTTHRAYIGLDPQPEWLAVDEGLARCGLNRTEFDAWVTSSLEADHTDAVSGIHRSARRRGAIEIATPTADPLEVPLVARRWACVRPDPRSVVRAVAEEFAIDFVRITSRSKSGAIVLARRTAVQAGVRLGLTVSEMATALGMSRQAAGRTARIPVAPALLGAVISRCEKVSKVTPSPGKR